MEQFALWPAIVLIAAAGLLLTRCQAALTAERIINFYAKDETAARSLGAARKIYEGGFVGIDPAGYVKPFEVGDALDGIALETVDNTSGAAAALGVRVRVLGEADLPLASVAISDVGRAVYATDDQTLAFKGHPDAWVGRVIAKAGTDLARVRLRRSFGGLGPADTGHIEIAHDMQELFAPVLTAGNEQFVKGLRLDAIGAGIVAGGVAPVQGLGGVWSLLLDNDNEAQGLSIETANVFSITGGITFEARLNLHTAGGAATDDLDFGLVCAPTAATGITDAMRANLDVSTSGIRLAKFHLDCNANDIFVGTDDDTNVLGPTDTTIDNVVGAGNFKDFKIIIRPTGLVEFWINVVRVATGTIWTVGSAAGLMAGLINIEKSTGTGVPEVRVKRKRVAGAAA